MQELLVIICLFAASAFFTYRLVGYFRSRKNKCDACSFSSINKANE